MWTWTGLIAFLRETTRHLFLTWISDPLRVYLMENMLSYVDRLKAVFACDSMILGYIMQYFVNRNVKFCRFQVLQILKIYLYHIWKWQRIFLQRKISLFHICAAQNNIVNVITIKIPIHAKLNNLFMLQKRFFFL